VRPRGLEAKADAAEDVVRLERCLAPRPDAEDIEGELRGSNRVNRYSAKRATAFVIEKASPARASMPTSTEVSETSPPASPRSPLRSEMNTPGPAAI
jgi:hypothetical protein